MAVVFTYLEPSTDCNRYSWKEIATIALHRSIGFADCERQASFQQHRRSLLGKGVSVATSADLCIEIGGIVGITAR